MVFKIQQINNILHVLLFFFANVKFFKVVLMSIVKKQLLIHEQETVDLIISLSVNL